MKVSTKGRYALRLMIDLAQRDGGVPVSLRDIAARQDISDKYLEQIAAQLCRAGLVKSVRGPAGGYRLAREPGAYTAGDILRVTEGGLAPVACVEDEPNRCPRSDRCTTLAFWQGLARAIDAYVDGVTLADLAQGRRDLPVGD